MENLEIYTAYIPLWDQTAFKLNNFKKILCYYTIYSAILFIGGVELIKYVSSFFTRLSMRRFANSIQPNITKPNKEIDEYG